MNKKNIIKIIKNPKFIFLKLDQKKLIRLPDKLFLQLAYEYNFDKKLNLNNPETFNEKIQWLKLNDRKPEYTKMVDKYEVKKYVSNIIGEKYIIPTLGVYDKFDDINFDKLPMQFVMKCTHDSGGLVICKNKNEFNREDAKKKINKYLKRNFYYIAREWPYKNVKPKIIIEKYLEDETKSELKDYKLFCFNGKVKIVLVCSNRFIKLNETFFDEDWNMLNLIEGEHDRDETVKKPYNFEKMKELAEKLSKKMKFLRVDFYEVEKNIYFGELTFYPASGYESFKPDIWNKKFGEWIQL